MRCFALAKEKKTAIWLSLSLPLSHFSLNDPIENGNNSAMIMKMSIIERTIATVQSVSRWLEIDKLFIAFSPAFSQYAWENHLSSQCYQRGCFYLLFSIHPFTHLLHWFSLWLFLLLLLHFFLRRLCHIMDFLSLVCVCVCVRIKLTCKQLTYASSQFQMQNQIRCCSLVFRSPPIFRRSSIKSINQSGSQWETKVSSSSRSLFSSRWF